MILNFHSGPNEISKIFIEREAEEESQRAVTREDRLRETCDWL